jgi:hypothetical protein
MILPAADELLAPVMAIDGFRLACLIDGSTGMVLATREFRESQDGPAPPTAAAGAADVINALTLLNGRLATGEHLEDVMVTFSDSFFMVRPVGLDQQPHILLLVIADRQRTNLAMAHRCIRAICASFTA